MGFSPQMGPKREMTVSRLGDWIPENAKPPLHTKSVEVYPTGFSIGNVIKKTLWPFKKCDFKLKGRESETAGASPPQWSKVVILIFDKRGSDPLSDVNTKITLKSSSPKEDKPKEKSQITLNNRFFFFAELQSWQQGRWVTDSGAVMRSWSRESKKKNGRGPNLCLKLMVFKSIQVRGEDNVTRWGWTASRSRAWLQLRWNWSGTLYQRPLGRQLHSALRDTQRPVITQHDWSFKENQKTLSCHWRDEFWV